MKIRWISLILMGWMLGGRCHGQLPSLLELSFNNGGGPNGDVLTLVRDGSGRFLAGGQFTSFNGSPRGRLLRLTAEGSLDSSFAAGSGANNHVYAVAVQPDGKLLIGGTFTQFNDQPRTYLARLEANGDLDPSFDVSINNELRCIIVEPDGRILIAGRFTQVAGQSRGRIARLNANGTLDATFDPGLGASDNIRSLLRLADGRILIGGQFSSYNGTNRVRVARLNSTGGLDLSFSPGIGADEQVRSIATDAAGLVYIGGDFFLVDGVERRGLARLLANGSVDPSFVPAAGMANVRSVVVQPDGKIWVGGAFYIVGPPARSHITRLNANGTVDLFFDPFTLPNDEVFSIVLDGTNRVVFGGDFTRIDDRSRVRIASLLPERRGFAYAFESNYESDLEQSGAAALRIRRYGSIGLASSVAMTTRDRTAIAGQDYTAFNGSVSFAPNELTVEALVPILDDAYPEGTEWFEATLQQPPESAGLTNNLVRNVYIADNEIQATLDDSFLPRSVTGPIHSAAVQPDGRIVIGGEFRYTGGCQADYLARLKADGETDCDFYVHSTGANGLVMTVKLQPDGLILVGGSFQNFNSAPAGYITRVKPDGSTDPDFLAGNNLNAPVLASALQPDGKILVGGMFTSFGSTARTYLARLNSNGTLDPTFGCTLDGFVRAILVRTNGQILVAGDFTTVNNQGRGHVARLHSNGSVDLTFTPAPGPNKSVMGMAEQTDGRLMVAGEFDQVDGLPRDRLARLGLDGRLDSSFKAGSLGGGPRVNTVAVQADGKVVFGGLFASVAHSPRNFIARVHPDGTLDSAFLASSGANDEVSSVQVLANGQILITGRFTELAGATRLRIARMYPEPSLNRFEIPSTNFTVHEWAATADIIVQRAGPSDTAVSVDYTTVPGTALAGTDLIPKSGTLTFAPLETVKVISIPIVNDGVPEVAKQFRVRLSNPGGGAILGAVTETTVDLIDNDAGFSLTEFELTLREGTGPATLVVQRNSDGPSPVSVDFATLNGTALGGPDYQPTNGTLTFGAGEYQKTIIIPIHDNPEFEGRESFRFVLSNPSSGTGLGQIRESTIQIEDQDSTLEWSAMNDSLEGSSPVPCHVYRRGLMTERATVRVRSSGGTAVAGEDYVAIDLTLVFEPGDSLQYFYVTNLNDGLVEPLESIRFTMSDLTGRAIVNGSSETNVFITDNDLGIEFHATRFYGNESAPTATAIVRRGDDGTNTLTVQYSTSGGLALSGIDFQPVSGTLVLPPGETNAIIRIPMLPDRDLETNESFTLTLSQPGPGATLGSRFTVPIVILDDERAGSVDVGFIVNPDEVSRNGWYSWPVHLSALSNGQLIVSAPSGLGRFESDGRQDTNFVTNPWDFYFDTITVPRPDGRILVGGSSSNDFNGAGSYCLRLFETNGTQIPSFAFPIYHGRTASIVLRDDGRILIGGDFYLTPFGNDHRSILRVLPTGEIDPTFHSETFEPNVPQFLMNPSTIEALAVQPDGKILAAGTFDQVNGQPHRKIARFTSDGFLDPSLNGPTVLGTYPSPYGSYYHALVVQNDGRIIVGGSFTNLGGVAANNLARLNVDGSLDSSFHPTLETDEYVFALALQPDGRLLVATGWYDWPAGRYVSRVQRLLLNGAVDPSFDAGQLPDRTITDVILLPGGDIAISGGFSEVNGIYRPLVARLKGDGLTLRPERAGAGAIVVNLFNTWPGGVSVLEASADLIHWQPVRTNVATSASQQWLQPAVGSQNFYRARHHKPQAP